MEGIRKISIIALLAVFVMSLGTISASAQIGWGDTLDDAILLYHPGGGNSQASAPIESTSDYDFFLIDNRYGGDTLHYSLQLYSPPGLNYDMQLITMDRNGRITEVKEVHDSGAGKRDAIYAPLANGHSLYVKVQSHGAYDYDPYNFYVLDFIKLI
ncbi:hypothetical protein [Paenibacillus humicus]|uniref:hypothetical protein n=1 Tax=Paenibacillus humicus TaxID=412861 RepID=UPI003D2C7E4A